MTGIAPGQVLLPPTELRPSAQINTFDARAGAISSLAAYLRCQTFMKWGAEAPNVSFQLKAVYEEWPESSVEVAYPSASITDIEELDADDYSFVPQPLEETWDGVEGSGLLWKLGEMSMPLQVDFWTQTRPDREAIAASLFGLFAPGESRSNVILSGHPEYFCRPVRCSLLGYTRVDDQNSIYEADRRLLARVQCDIDIVELRCGNSLKPNIRVDVGVNQGVALPKSESGALAPGCCPKE